KRRVGSWTPARPDGGRGFSLAKTLNDGKDSRRVTTDTLATLIDAAFERRADIAPDRVDADLLRALDDVITGLNAGTLRVAEKIDGAWQTHQWIKKAVLLYFRTRDNQVMPGATSPAFDKVPTRFGES